LTVIQTCCHIAFDRTRDGSIRRFKPVSKLGSCSHFVDCACNIFAFSTNTSIVDMKNIFAFEIFTLQQFSL